MTRLIIIAIAAAFLIAPIVADQKKKSPATLNAAPLPDKTAQSPAGDFLFRGLTIGPDMLPQSVSLNGSVTNSTSVTWTTAVFAFEAIDIDGKATVHDDFMCYGLKPGATQTLDNKKLLLAGNLGGTTGFRIRFVGGENVITYTFTMAKPYPSDSMFFEDSNLTAAFTVRDQDLSFEISNKLDGPIKIDWNQSSYIDPFGKSHGVTHAGVRYTDAANAKPATTIPPTARITDSVTPSDNIHFESGGYGGWRTNSLLPKTLSGEKLKGQTIGLFMVMEINGKQINYLFSFKIDDVLFR